MKGQRRVPRPLTAHGGQPLWAPHQNPTIIADVEATLAAADIAPSQLELTKTVLTREALAVAHLSVLHALCVTVAIDDFGTGLTSIGQLAHLPVDTLEIDRSFTAAPDPRHRALVKVIIETAHAFNLRVVGEGVEDAINLAMLTDLGCDAIQGCLFARPMPADTAARWLAE